MENNELLAPLQLSGSCLFKRFQINVQCQLASITDKRLSEQTYRLSKIEHQPPRCMTWYKLPLDESSLPSLKKSIPHFQLGLTDKSTYGAHFLSVLSLHCLDPTRMKKDNFTDIQDEFLPVPSIQKLKKQNPCLPALHKMCFLPTSHALTQIY